ncbi:unnamed protein product [Owenia fusiformis]|uniref:RING-type domain-containing protein n=1 Tax=Owenia fusiformis TaxID=6347 RepID=A0A8S4PFB2_OWEFU|nr:unnamed protein product [Owenia fusiformis]
MGTESSKDGNEIPNKEAFTCPLCHKIPSQPKMTPCMHIFCLECLEKEIEQKDKPDVLRCPVCKVQFMIPKEGVKSLKTNTTLEDILYLFKSQKPSVQNCGICLNNDEKTVAVSRCINCNDFICGKCTKTHQFIKTLNDHTLIPLTGDAKADTEQALEMLPKSIKYCGVHTNEALRYFCSSHGCNKPICRTCCIETHKGHNYDNLEKSINQDMNNIDKIIEISGRRKKMTEAEISKAKRIEDIIINSGQVAIGKVEAAMKVDMEIVERHYKAQLATIEKVTQESLKSNKTHTEKLEVEMDKENKTIHHLQVQKKYGHPVEIINLRKELSQKVLELDGSHFICSQISSGITVPKYNDNNRHKLELRNVEKMLMNTTEKNESFALKQASCNEELELPSKGNKQNEEIEATM